MRASIALLSAAATFVLPGFAAASTVTSTPLGGGVSQAQFWSGPEPSDVTLNGASGSALTFSDALQTLTAGAGCTAGSPVVCPPGPADVELGKGDDRFAGFSLFDIVVNGGRGDDVIQASGNQTDVRGGADDDVLDLGANGRSVGEGDRGDDALRGNGAETVLDGGAGSDLVVGTAPLYNTVNGGRGADQLVSRYGASSTANGGGGDDVIIVRSVGPFEPLGSGNFGANGDGGDDTIVGGPGRETITGGPGDDVIDVSGDAGHLMGGPGDAVGCGNGDDTVYVDPDDVAAADCETILPGPMPASAAVASALAHLAQVFPDSAPVT